MLTIKQFLPPLSSQLILYNASYAFPELVLIEIIIRRIHYNVVLSMQLCSKFIEEAQLQRSLISFDTNVIVYLVNVITAEQTWSLWNDCSVIMMKNFLKVWHYVNEYLTVMKSHLWIPTSFYYRFVFRFLFKKNIVNQIFCYSYFSILLFFLHLLPLLFSIYYHYHYFKQDILIILYLHLVKSESRITCVFFFTNFCVESVFTFNEKKQQKTTTTTHLSV